MRILIASAHRNVVGGVEKYLQAALAGLLDRGHDLGILYEYPSTPGREQIAPPKANLPMWCVSECGSPSALRSVADWKPDLVYSHGLGSAHAVEVENALLDNYPVVLYLHNYDRTCATGQKCFTFPQVQPCSRKIGPMCLVLHYPRRCGGLHPEVMLERYRRHTQLNARLSDHRAILVASTHMRREVERHGVGPDKLHLVPLPTTDIVPDSNAPVQRRPNGKVLFIGRLTDIKGADYLIQAIPRAARKLDRPLTITIAGDGPQRAKLGEMADRLGTAVEFTGWVNTQEKLHLMREAELLAVPSLWPEPFGLVGIEAGCVGLPAVGYASGGIPDWLISGDTGELAPNDPPSVDGLAEAIVRALASSSHYKRLSRGAWDLAKGLTLENHLARLEPIFVVEPLFSGPGRPRTAAIDAPSES